MSEIAKGYTEAYAAGPDTYERVRPTYPDEAIAYLERELGIGAGATVVDVAAGTGKLTRALVKAGRDVIAVEPVVPMLEELARIAPSVRAVAGSAEALPVESGSVDAIVVGQAFHWFDGHVALAEFHRVLRTGTGIALLWNRRDRSVDWVRELVDIGREYRDRVDRPVSGVWRKTFDETKLFSPLTLARFAHVQPITPQMALDRKAAAPFIAALSPLEREAVLERARQFLRTHPATRDRDVIELPYQTEVYCSRRLGD